MPEDEDYIPGEYRAPPCTGFVLAAILGAFFWAAIIWALLA